jgi:hypothetical protein
LAHYALNDVKEGNMADTDRDVRLQIMLQPEELRAIEDWRFSKRMPSRASAVRELLRRGLTSEGFKLAEAGKHILVWRNRQDGHGNQPQKRLNPLKRKPPQRRAGKG